MADFIIEYVITQVRVVDVTARTREDAEREVKEWHGQLNTEMISESVILIRTEEDK